MRPWYCLFLLVPLAAYGQSREILQLQRDMAAVQAELRNMQASTAEKLNAIQAAVQQTLEQTQAANKAVAGLEAKVNERMEKQTTAVAQPVAVMGTKVDQMSSDFQNVRDSLTDVNARMRKLEQKLDDVMTAVRTINAPPLPPPAGSATAMPVAPPIPADTLYHDALRDKLAGKFELALKGFGDYLQFHSDKTFAPSAAYNIGEIHFLQDDFESAVKDFDAVLERWAESDKTPDAMYNKGRALVKLGRKTDAQKEFRALRAKYPRHTLAPKACTELQAIGFGCSAGAAPKKKGDD
jgi:TolA-binding protein